MTFEKLARIVDGKTLLLTYVNDNGENAIVEWSCDHNAYKVTTAQHNDWCRVNYYYEDGSVDEFYEK